MQITIHYYAILREQRGLDAETVEVSSTSLQQLYQDLSRTFAFSIAQRHIRPAINDEFCDWDHPVANGDRVVFVPPVAGG
jgi:sulfur-carrier protein